MEEKDQILPAENGVHIAGVTGSSPVSPTTNSPIKSDAGSGEVTFVIGSDVPSPPIDLEAMARRVNALEAEVSDLSNRLYWLEAVVSGLKNPNA